MDKGAITEQVSTVLYILRDRRVILDADIAAIYDRPTSAINQARKRNDTRFPEAYAFQLTKAEWEELKSQNVISSAHGGRRTRPWAYTEHGFAMLSMVLKGPVADRLAPVIIDTFVQYRQGTLPDQPVLAGPEAGAEREKLRKALYRQMQALLEMELPSGNTTSGELKSLTKSALGRIKAVLDGPSKRNELVVAEIAKLEAETAKLYAETQRAEAESANLWADTYQKRLNLIGQLREMAVQLDRDDAVDLLDQTFGRQERGLPKP